MDKKILFLASTRGHVLHFHAAYLKALKDEGVHIHAAWAGSDEPAENIEKIFSLPFEKRMSALGNFKAAAMLGKIMRSEGYDALIVHTSLAAFFARLPLLFMAKRPKCINMVHGYLFDENTSPLKKTILLAAEKLTAPVTDLLLTMNRWDFELAKDKRLGKKVEFIPGVGVDFAAMHSDRSAETRKSLGISPEAFVLIYPAEFSRRKSQSILIQALAKLAQNIVLVLPGTGKDLDACKAQAKALGLEDRVIFPGYVKDMGAFYTMADAAVSASRSEGLPFNIMEAMHFALPIAASDVKGNNDLIKHRINGLLYPYGDTEACAGAIEELAHNREKAYALGREAKADVSGYSLEAVLPQLMEKYNSILK